MVCSPPRGSHAPLCVVLRRLDQPPMTAFFSFLEASFSLSPHETIFFFFFQLRRFRSPFRMGSLLASRPTPSRRSLRGALLFLPCVPFLPARRPLILLPIRRIWGDTDSFLRSPSSIFFWVLPEPLIVSRGSLPYGGSARQAFRFFFFSAAISFKKKNFSGFFPAILGALPLSPPNSYLTGDRHSPLSRETFSPSAEVPSEFCYLNASCFTEKLNL